MKASIAIFQKQVSYKREVKPDIPDELFEAALRVSQNKGCELVKTKSGIYVVSFSETGPWTNGTEELTLKNWLPVYIARMEKWSSGGITQEELHNYIERKTQ